MAARKGCYSHCAPIQRGSCSHQDQMWPSSHQARAITQPAPEFDLAADMSPHTPTNSEYDCVAGMSPQTPTISVNWHLDPFLSLDTLRQKMNTVLSDSARQSSSMPGVQTLMGVCDNMERSSSTSLNHASAMAFPAPNYDKDIVIWPQTATNSVNLHLDWDNYASEYDLAAGMSSQTLTNSVNLPLDRVMDAEVETSSIPGKNHGNPTVPQEIVYSSNLYTQPSVCSSSGSALRDGEDYALPSTDTVQQQMQNALCGSKSQSPRPPSMQPLADLDLDFDMVLDLGAWHKMKPSTFSNVNLASIGRNPDVPQQLVLRGPMSHMVQQPTQSLDTGHHPLLNMQMSYQSRMVSASTDNSMVSTQTAMPCTSPNLTVCNDQPKNRAHTSHNRPLDTAWTSTATTSISQGSASITEAASSVWPSTATPSTSYDSAKTDWTAMFALTPKVEPGTYDSGGPATRTPGGKLSNEPTAENSTTAVRIKDLSMGSETSDLSMHTRTESGERPHIYELCGKGVWDLSSHMKAHAGEESHLCAVCGTGFKHSSGLVRHMRCHTGERPYSCTLCEKAFFQASHLSNHMRIHTGERPYRCNLCDKAFKRADILVKHMRIHTGERPYHCTLCEKAFARADKLVVHMRCHNRERPFKCAVTACGQQFKLKHHLKRHRRTHAAQRLY